MKQVIIVRTDLNMRKGKMIAQGSHASVNAIYRFIRDNHPLKNTIERWFQDGQTKIVVGIDSEEGLKQLYNQAQAAGLISSYIVDAGKTEFKQPTATAVAIGPADANVIDKITGNLKLL